MGAPLSSAQIADVLDVRFRDVAEREYDKGKSFVPTFCTVKDSDRDTEKYSEVNPMGKFQEFLGSVEYDAITQGYDVTATHVEYALATSILRRTWDDAQFDVIDDNFAKLGRSAFKTHEDHLADFFNSIFSASNVFYTHTEGVAVCSNSHTTTTGASTSTGFDNYFTGELNPANLTSMISQYRQFKDPAGDYIDATPNILIVPVQLRDRAYEIIKTSVGLDDANQNINVHDGRFEIIDWVRLNDANNFFLANREMMKENLYWFWRVRPEYASQEAFDNIVAKFRGYMRYSYLHRDWRWVIGSEAG